jgi:peroxiredoxin
MGLRRLALFAPALIGIGIGMAILAVGRAGDSESPAPRGYDAVTPRPVTFIPPTPLPTRSPTPDPVLDQPAPDLTLTTLDGDPLRLRDLRGEIVFLNFWATWCAPCKEELPELQALHETGSARVIALTDPTEGQTEALVRAFAQDLGLTLTVALSSDRDLYRNLGIAQIPMTIIIDRRGVMRFRHLGELHDHDAQAYLARLDEAESD